MFEDSSLMHFLVVAPRSVSTWFDSTKVEDKPRKLEETTYSWRVSTVAGLVPGSNVEESLDAMLRN